MAIIGVPGGTGSFGKTLIEAITRRGKHEVKILSRKTNDVLAAELGVPIIAVDYSSVEDLTRVFEEHKIHTVASTVNTFPQDGVPPEVNMIRAAQASKVTQRFIPCNWGLPIHERHWRTMTSTSMKSQALDELKKTDLEYTVFYGGFFLDYYTGPSIKSNMGPIVVVVDTAHNMAAIPGSGNTPVVFTHSSDLAKYADRALDFEKWEPEYFAIGDKVTINQMVKLAETAKGTKFTVVHNSVEDLEKGIVTVLPGMAKLVPIMPLPKELLNSFLCGYSLAFDDGSFDFDEERTLNKVFPEIVPLKAKQALEAAAKGA